MTKNLVIYHDTCMDGFMSMVIARGKFGENGEYFPCQYGKYKVCPPTDIETRPILQYNGKSVSFHDKDVYVVDFSFKRDELNLIAKYAKKVVVLDHHKTALEELMEPMPDVGPNHWTKHSDLAKNIELTFNMDKAGCWLAYEYFDGKGVDNPLVYLVGLRDLWKHKSTEHEKEAEALNLFLGTIGWDYEKWKFLYESDYATYDAIEGGKAIYDFFMQKCKEIAEHAVFMQTIYDSSDPNIIVWKRMALVNCPYFMASEVGAILSRKADIACMYSITKEGDVIMSLRSSNGTDVSKYAKQHGGGGHAAAAGFKLPSVKHLYHFLSEKHGL